MSYKIWRATRIIIPNALTKMSHGVFEYSQPIYSALARAPKDGIIIDGKLYKHGQILPFPRMYYGKGAETIYNQLPALSSGLRPSPMNYSTLSTGARWATEIGLSGLGYLYCSQ